MPLKLTTYYTKENVPEDTGTNIFHSKTLFTLYEATAGYTPILIIATLEGKEVARLLATIRHNTKGLLSSFVKRCEVFGYGYYQEEGNQREEIFGEMLEHLTNEVLDRCFLIEFRNLDNGLFGYRLFRQNLYFPLHWLRVRNSLHKLSHIDEFYTPSRIRQIKKGLQNGSVISTVQNIQEVNDFSRMLSKNYSSHIRKHFPNEDFFRQFYTIFISNGLGQIHLIKHNNRIIGGAVCIYSKSEAYLLFYGGMAKSHLKQHPCVLAVYAALLDAWQRGIRHLEFLDSGMPYQRHGYSSFILSFGGRQISTRRWFRFRWNYLNRFLTFLYR